MPGHPLVHIKDSLTVKLLKVIFGVYLGVMLIATLTHITVEYSHVKERTLHELKIFEETFKKQLTETVWFMDMPRLQTVTTGMLEIPDIIGVKITEQNLGEIAVVGTIINHQGETVTIDHQGVQVPVHGKERFSRLFWTEFPLIHHDATGEFILGETVIYSSSSVVFQKVKLGFMFLIINEIMKMTVIWLLFLWVGRKLLSQPLAALTSVAEQIELDNLQHLSVDVKTSGRNELKILEEAFNAMIQKLNDGIEQRKQTEKLKIAKETAEAANRAKSTFLANMSHELRTPLNAILGFAQIMARDPHTPEERGNLRIIQRSGEHLLTLINQVLNLSKIETGRITLNEKNFDLYRLLDDLEDMIRLRAEKKELQLLFNRTDTVPRYVRTDEIKLREVLINLLNNAIKFTEKGEVRLKIENCQLNIETPEDTAISHQSLIVNLQFSISDTGSGIAPDDLDHIFEAFVQTKTGQAAEGTGLGLSISHKFVQLMGGDIHVESEVGRGTTFMFDIQCEIVDSIDNRQSSIVNRVIAIEPGQPRYRLLIVDDEPDNRKLLVKLLANVSSPRSGFELREASNGQETVEICENWEPHLIWMDMRMPVMDGYEATRYIKSEIRNSKSEIQTVIIAVTASSFKEERAVILEAGCDDFLRKPFRDTEVFDLLHKHLGMRFVCEESQKSKVKTCPERSRRGQKSKIEDVLTPETVAALPDKLRISLQDAAEAADLDMALSLIEQIREQNEPLAETLAELVKNYRFDILQALFEDITQ